jgi:uncharacterized damage-inducible protein DinB
VQQPEPWLRGPLHDVHPLLQPLFFSFAQVREDLAQHVAGLTRDQLWRICEAASVGFHLKHLAGSVDRLTTYLLGQQLTATQLAALRQEQSGKEDVEALLRVVDETLSRAEAQIRSIDPRSMFEPRAIGRKQLPTTVLGLLVHISEHTQRHLGQAITTAKIVRATG